MTTDSQPFRPTKFSSAGEDITLQMLPDSGEAALLLSPAMSTGEDLVPRVLKFVLFL